MLTVKECALALDVSPDTIRRWIRDRGLPARRRGAQHYSIQPTELANWCADEGIEIFNPFLARPGATG
jgi:excisionase family DNA binding protein